MHAPEQVEVIVVVVTLAGAIIAIVFGVMIVFVVLCVCCWGYCRSREEQFVDSERYTRERSFSLEMPPVAEYGKK